MDKDYIEVKIPILDSVDEMKAVKTFTQEQLWYVCAIAKAFEESEQQVKKQQEVIDKISNYIDNYDVFKVFSFPLMKKWEENQVKSSIDYEFKTSLIKDLKDILKEV